MILQETNIRRLTEMLKTHLEVNFIPKLSVSTQYFIIDNFVGYWNEEITLEELEKEIGSDLENHFQDFLFDQNQ